LIARRDFLASRAGQWSISSTGLRDTKIAIHPALGEVTLSELLASWVVHDLNHLDQIVKTIAKQYTSAIGPWRELLPIVDAH